MIPPTPVLRFSSFEFEVANARRISRFSGEDSGDSKMAKKGIDYSKWDNIEDSDDVISIPYFLGFHTISLLL